MLLDRAGVGRTGGVVSERKMSLECDGEQRNGVVWAVNGEGMQLGWMELKQTVLRRVVRL